MEVSVSNRACNQARRQFLASSGALGTFASLPALARPVAGSLPELSAVQAVTAIRSGDVKAEDYARALLDQCDSHKHLNAFITLDRDTVLHAARAVDLSRAHGGKLGPLAGLPVPLKDSICTSALPTTSGTRSLRSFKPLTDAVIWQRLSRSHAVLLGKTNLHEMSLGWTSANQVFGPVRNPYDLRRIPGGSSGGTAVAVAARMAPVGIGEDTNGSIRVPAGMCGIAGLRPTHGRYPGEGVIPLSPTLDTVGPMARRVSDLCLIDAVVTGDAMVTEPADLRGLRFGVARLHYFSDLDTGVAFVVEEALRRLRDAGATIVEAEVPALAELVGKVTLPIILFEARRNLSRFLTVHGAPVDFAQLVDQVSPEIRKQVDDFLLESSPNAVSAHAYQDAIEKHRPALQATWQNYFRDHRLVALVSPVVRMPAPPIPDPPRSPGSDVEISGIIVPARTAFARNIAPSSSAGLPSIVLPGGLTQGLPVGIELDGPTGSDRYLLALALAMEQVLPPMPAPQLTAP
jgi:mandelamide amidase